MILGLRFDLERNQATLENHISNDFKSLEQRVSVLEKKVQQLIANMSKQPQHHAPVAEFDDAELKRLAALLAALQNEHNSLTMQVNDGFQQL
jgi:uncharacterized protein involved in exopolysaccharide biosynthesis